MGAMFRDTLPEMEKRTERLLQHFRHAEYLFFENSKRGLPTPQQLLWILIEDAMHTARITPFDEHRMVSRVGTVMPAVRDTLEAATFRENARLEAGLAQHDATEVRETASETAVDRMVDILDLFRFVVGGRAGTGAKRMKRVVMARAAGLSIEQCGRIWDRHRIDFDRRSMHDVKSRVLGQMLRGIETELGLKRTSRSFRRMTIREIERWRKLRQQQEVAANAG